MKQAATVTPVAEFIRNMTVTEQTFYCWNKQYGGMGMGALHRPRLLEEGSRKLKQFFLDQPDLN